MMYKLKLFLQKVGEGVAPLSLSALTKSKTFENMFDSETESEMIIYHFLGGPISF